MMNAKEYALSRGYPIKTVRRLCQQGEIPILRIGRRYLLKPETADRVFDEMAERETERRRQICNKVQPQIMKRIKRRTGSFLEQVAAAQRQLEASL